MTTYRTEFAVEGVWYTNALRFDTPEEAKEEAQSRFSRWTMPAAWRVVPSDYPEKESYGGDADTTAFTVVAA